MSTIKKSFTVSSLAFLALLLFSTPAFAWWNAEWTVRKKITIDTAGIPAPIGTASVLVRLHDGNFQFLNAKEDGGDIRFVAGDDKTPLAYHIEKYDSLLNEAFVWVKVPDIKAGTTIWLYYGNAGEKVDKADNPKGTFDADTALIYHFAEKGSAPSDSSASGINATDAVTSVEGSIIGSGIRLDGTKAITIPATPNLNFAEGASFTWSAWIKPGVLTSNAAIYSRHDGANAFIIGVNDGVPYVEVNTAGNPLRSTAGEPIALNIWRHLAIVVSGSKITVYLDGESYATLDATVPALSTAALLGKDGIPGQTDTNIGFNGELDELEIAKTARPAGLIQLAAISQSGSDKAGKLLAIAADEVNEHAGGGELAKHFSLIAGISESLTIDGWVVIILCGILAAVGWFVTIDKLIYLSKLKKATGAFLAQWKHISSDLTVLDHGDKDNISSLGGKATPKAQKLMRQSPLYHIYHLGSEEIHNRVTNAKGDFKGLSGRSMQAIKATLDGGLTREVQNLNGKLVFLTIGIAGGPYLGLLGTVIGVMITFAVIAKSGEVEVNSIAPGIAGALLATVAGLAVAIPALFAYSYVASRIKDVIAEMQIFIDEFLTKIAEFYPSKD